MPNYEYECTQCAHRFELWQSVGEDAPPCPECKSEVKKIFHVPRVIFKGSGFYVTDLRAEKEKSPGGSSAAKASSGETADKPSEAKPSESKASDAKPADSGSGSAGNGGAPSKSDATGSGSGSSSGSSTAAKK